MPKEINYRQAEGIVRIYHDDGVVEDVPWADFHADPLRAQDRVPLDQAKREALKRLAGLRWEKTQKMSYEGIATPCNDGARAALMGAVMGLQLAASEGPITWKLSASDFRSWSLAELIAFGQAMRAHVQACFDWESTVAAQIAAATTSREVMGIDLTTGWPATTLAEVGG